jgi:hypothetical protein
MDTLPRTRASHEPIGYHRGMKTLGDHLGSIRCSSCLRLQLFCVETFLLLPKCQRNGRDFARQRQTRHLWLHPVGQQTRVKFVERSHATAGPGGRRVENPSRRNVGGLRIGLFNPIAEALEFPDHSGGAVSQ